MTATFKIDINALLNIWKTSFWRTVKKYQDLRYVFVCNCINPSSFIVTVTNKHKKIYVSNTRKWRLRAKRWLSCITEYCTHGNIHIHCIHSKVIEELSHHTAPAWGLRESASLQSLPYLCCKQFSFSAKHYPSYETNSVTLYLQLCLYSNCKFALI